MYSQILVTFVSWYMHFMANYYLITTKILIQSALQYHSANNAVHSQLSRLETQALQLYMHNPLGLPLRVILHDKFIIML